MELTKLTEDACWVIVWVWFMVGIIVVTAVAAKTFVVFDSGSFNCKDKIFN